MTASVSVVPANEASWDDLHPHSRRLPPPRRQPRPRRRHDRLRTGAGARAIEGYPMVTQPGQEIIWDELRVGSRSIFAAAGFAEVSRPTLRRVVMRIAF